MLVLLVLHAAGQWRASAGERPDSRHDRPLPAGRAAGHVLLEGCSSFLTNLLTDARFVHPAAALALQWDHTRQRRVILLCCLWASGNGDRYAGLDMGKPRALLLERCLAELQ